MLPGTTTRRTTSKFLRDSSSFHVVLPGASGWRRNGVPGRVARDATRVAGTLGEEDRLHLRLEELEVERRRRGGGGRGLLHQ